MATRRIHRFFLWAYYEAPACLGRSAAAGDTACVAYAGEVLGNFDQLLHIHHEGDDLLMYPHLEERAPACALHIGQIQEQHRQVTAARE
ncbi:MULTISPECIES: hemerythrin domain-containing protein [unclassified Pseudarthrobacter]|uniref:hemerythrin domain-containing protein n=1 Tax=unclassified Pseudarthrobacter TaxID=2647000 RepID=UPI00364175D9